MTNIEEHFKILWENDNLKIKIYVLYLPSFLYFCKVFVIYDLI